MYLLHKQIIAFLFLLIVAVPLFVSLKFIVEESLIQQAVEEKMNTVVLQSVTVSKADIIWIRAGKEILVDDKIFDVKDYETKDEVVTLTGYFDREETALLSAYKNYTEKNNQDNPLSKSTFKFLFSTDYHSHKEIIAERNWQLVLATWPVFDERLPLFPDLTFTQPPKL